MSTLFDSCTEFPQNPLPWAPVESQPIWQLVMAILFPILFILFKEGNLSLSSEQIMSLYQHVVGQISSFSSTEIIRHFMVAPDAHFPSDCNLTQAECQDLWPLGENLNTSTLCLHSDLTPKQLFDSLHSVPNLSFVLMGSALVFLLSNLQSLSSKKNPIIKWYPVLEKYTFCSKHWCKFLILTTFLATLYFSIWQSLHQHSLTEMAFSFFYGAGVQLAILNVTTKQSLTTPPVNYVSIPLQEKIRPIRCEI